MRSILTNCARLRSRRYFCLLRHTEHARTNLRAGLIKPNVTAAPLGSCAPQESCCAARRENSAGADRKLATSANRAGSAITASPFPARQMGKSK